MSSTMPVDTPATKAKRKAISLDTKINILDQLATGQGTTAVGKKFGIHEATIRTIKKSEAAIRESVCSGTEISVKSTSYIRDALKEKMEKALVLWIEDKSQKRMPVDGIAIKQTALRIYKRVKELQSSTTVQSKQREFTASTGWMTGFLKRHALRNLKMKGETELVDAKQLPKLNRNSMECGEFNNPLYDNIDEFLINQRLRENEFIDLTLEHDRESEQGDNVEEDPLDLNATLIKEGLDLAKRLGNHFGQHDPDEERATKFQCELNALMSSYRELYNGLSRNQTQSLTTDCLPKNTELLTRRSIDDSSKPLISQPAKRMRLFTENENS
ncbi:uncharacterized protein LOC105664779 [Ceratitis capitata]|uniref:uncharacterized protein LOC105664779 n=1 Tax=Ceratitis capitata TaxID=7213 RepID=UPI00061882FB|nr:uncharacterized protein LOC105664779 [Ceratitis capitata]